jgi:hypothetical protein
MRKNGALGPLDGVGRPFVGEITKLCVGRGKGLPFGLISAAESHQLST